MNSLFPLSHLNRSIYFEFKHRLQSFSFSSNEGVKPKLSLKVTNTEITEQKIIIIDFKNHTESYQNRNAARLQSKENSLLAKEGKNAQLKLSALIHFTLRTYLL